jgi:hypothetical protein
MTDVAANQKVTSTDYAHGISFGEAFVVWLRVAMLSFGGPAGQIAVMHRILVEEKNWISEGRFLHALNYCMLLPGPEAQQLATYIGWLLHRTAGESDPRLGQIVTCRPGSTAEWTFRYSNKLHSAEEPSDEIISFPNPVRSAGDIHQDPARGIVCCPAPLLQSGTKRHDTV